MSSPHPHPTERHDADYFKHVKPPSEEKKSIRSRHNESPISGPVVNPQARTHPLGGPGATWNGVPLNENHQQSLDADPDEQFQVSHDVASGQGIAEAAAKKEEEERESGWTTRQYIRSKGDKFQRKIQGQRKIVAGRLLKDEKKIERGRRMIHGEEEDFWSDSE